MCWDSQGLPPDGSAVQVVLFAVILGGFVSCRTTWMHHWCGYVSRGHCPCGMDCMSLETGTEGGWSVETGRVSHHLDLALMSYLLSQMMPYLLMSVGMRDQMTYQMVTSCDGSVCHSMMSHREPHSRPVMSYLVKFCHTHHIVMPCLMSYFPDSVMSYCVLVQFATVTPAQWWSWVGAVS